MLTFVQGIEASGRHLLQLITGILDLSKIGAGKLELAISPVVVKSVCEASVMFIKQMESFLDMKERNSPQVAL